MVRGERGMEEGEARRRRRRVIVKVYQREVKVMLVREMNVMMLC